MLDGLGKHGTMNSSQLHSRNKLRGLVLRACHATDAKSRGQETTWMMAFFPDCLTLFPLSALLPNSPLSPCPPLTIACWLAGDETEEREVRQERGEREEVRAFLQTINMSKCTHVQIYFVQYDVER